MEQDQDLEDGEFKIIRGSSHDGTLLFTIENVQKALLPLVNMECFYNKNPIKEETKSLKYKVGKLKIDSDYSSKAFSWPCVDEIVSIPVICYHVS